MKRPFAAFLLLTAAVTVLGQQAPQTLKPKSQKESEALQKVQAAAQSGNYEAEIQAINNVLENFADTEYKPMLLNMAVDAAAAKDDYPQMLAFGEKALQADPNNLIARATLAGAIAQRTRENDLDKDAKLKQATDYANKELELLKANDAAPPGIPADRWPDAKKQLTAQAYDALGLIADLDKKYPDAVQDFKTAVDTSPSPVEQVHLAKAYVDNKQYDEAIATADKVLAMNDAQPVVKQFAQQQKDAATKLKGAK